MKTSMEVKALILNSTSESHWLKLQIVALENRDIVDALNDVTTLKLILEMRLAELNKLGIIEEKE